MFPFTSRRVSLAFISFLMISACSSTASHIQSSTEQQYPEQATIDHNGEELHQLQVHLANIEEQIENLNKQINEMRQQQATISRYLNVRLSSNHNNNVKSTSNTKSSDNTAEARRLYHAGLYTQAIRLLKNADSGGNGSAEAQERMWLLLQNHSRLNNCESVINIGKRFNSQFPHHAQSANALYLVAVCQNRLQQQDIARVTCQQIINAYPNSSAASKARQLMSKKK